jgi:hypothetical protein
MEKKASYVEMQLRLWALHLSLRSDLGNSQPAWFSEIERVRTDATRRQEKPIANLVESYPWENLHPRNTAGLTALRDYSEASK